MKRFMTSALLTPANTNIFITRQENNAFTVHTLFLCNVNPMYNENNDKRLSFLPNQSNAMTVTGIYVFEGWIWRRLLVVDRNRKDRRGPTAMLAIE